MFEFLTKEGRAAIAERRKQKEKERIRQELLKKRDEFEAMLEKLPSYERARRYFHDDTRISVYDYNERDIKDVEYLYLMMEAIDSGKELRTGWRLEEIEKDPMKEFGWQYFNFFNVLLHDLKMVKEGFSYLERKSVKIQDIEKILNWAIEHGERCGRMFLYELRMYQDRVEEAAKIRSEAEYYRQTPWFWEKCDKYAAAADDSLAGRWSRVKTGEDFEMFIFRRLKEENLTCKRIGGSGDQGVDIIVSGGGRKIAIQCKFYSSPVDNSAVQQVFAGKMFYDCTDAFVVTNSYYSPGAIELAKKVGVQLCSHLDLLGELDRIIQAPDKSVATTARSTTTVPRMEKAYVG